MLSACLLPSKFVDDNDIALNMYFFVLTLLASDTVVFTIGPVRMKDLD
jgi:hypothetical protein